MVHLEVREEVVEVEVLQHTQQVEPEQQDKVMLVAPD
jgi:hypothetical protein